MPTDNEYIKDITFLKNEVIADEGVADLTETLEKVWKQLKGENQQDAICLRHKLTNIRQAVSRQVEAATDPDNISIKAEILANIASKKEEAQKLQELDLIYSPKSLVYLSRYAVPMQQVSSLI